MLPLEQPTIFIYTLFTQMFRLFNTTQGITPKIEDKISISLFCVFA